MSLTKNTITDNTIREKANLIIKSAKHSGISFTNEERILIRERFRKRLDMWITANNDIGDINKDRMIENLEKWSSEISCNYTIGWTVSPYDLMGTYYGLEDDYNPKKIPYMKVFPINATILFYEALAGVFHCAKLLEEALTNILLHSGLNSMYNSRVNTAHKSYNEKQDHKDKNITFSEALHLYDCWFFCLLDCMYYSLGGGRHLTTFGLSKETNSRAFSGSLNHIREAVRYGLKYISFLPDFMFGYCCEKYVYDAQLRIHNVNGPAYRDPKGRIKYYIKGVEVPEYVVMQPEKISLNLILKEKNQEVKSIMLERFGVEKFVKQSKAKVIDSHIEKQGESQLLEIDLGSGERGYFAKVICPTTLKEYLLRVPKYDTLKRAIAWTFGMRANDYEPVIET